MIRAEIARRHVSIPAFALAAGLSPRTIERLIGGEGDGYSDRTIARLEAVMSWETGSVQRVIEGRRPILVEDPILVALTEDWPHLSIRDRRVVLAVVQAMRKLSTVEDTRSR